MSSSCVSKLEKAIPQTWQKTQTSDLGDMDLIVWTWKNAKVMDLQTEH